MCKKLQRLQKLKANYLFGTLPNASHLHLLRNLTDLELVRNLQGNPLSDLGMDSFRRNYFRVWPELRIYNSVDFEEPLYDNPCVDLEMVNAPCDLEDCSIGKFQNNEDNM